MIEIGQERVSQYRRRRARKNQVGLPCLTTTCVKEFKTMNQVYKHMDVAHENDDPETEYYEDDRLACQLVNQKVVYVLVCEPGSAKTAVESAMKVIEEVVGARYVEHCSLIFVCFHYHELVHTCF